MKQANEKRNQKITVANVCFIEDEKNKKILLLKRNRPPMAGMYAGVGGKTEFGEDIKASCVREVKEETGLEVNDVTLRGVIKTVLQDGDSSWLLFVYTSKSFTGTVGPCDEGELCWVDRESVCKQKLIGFLKKILPAVLADGRVVEGTLVHDAQGNVIKETLSVPPLSVGS